MLSSPRKLLIRLMAASTVLLVLVVAGWLWVQWPVWTAEEFLKKYKARDYSCFDLVSNHSYQLNLSSSLTVISPSRRAIERLPRTISDRIVGRYRFQLGDERWYTQTLEAKYGQINIRVHTHVGRTLEYRRGGKLLRHVKMKQPDANFRYIPGGALPANE